MVELANLDTIDLKSLADGDTKESARLFEASKSLGLFQLNLANHPEYSKILDLLSHVYDAAKVYLDQAEAVKKDDFRPNQKPWSDRGYKKSDCDETFEISDDELFSGSPLPNVLQPYTAECKLFANLCRGACMTMLSSLSSSLEGDSSDSGVKLEIDDDVLGYAHKDSGTFTFVFYKEWGVEAELGDSAKWGFIKALPGCAIVQVANSLQRLSGDQLRSPTHRVHQPPDGPAKFYFVTYFLRPEHSAWLKTIKG